MADIYRTFPPIAGGNAQWLYDNPAGTVLRQGFFGDPPAPPPSGGGSNPSTIMGAGEVLWYADAAASPLWQNTDGTGAVTDGSVVRRIDGLAGPNAATTDNAREAIYRAGGGDPYIEGDAGSQLRASLSRAAGDFYAIIRVQFRGTGTNFDQPFTVATDTNTFYNGTAWGNVKLNPFLSPVDARFETGTGSEPASQDAPRNTWHTIEVYGTATANGLAVNGASFVTGSRSAAFPATGYIDLFNSVDGGSISPGVPTWFRRGAILNAIPDATQRAALLTWATDGDPGGAGTTDGVGSSAGTATASAVGASVRASAGTSAGIGAASAVGASNRAAAGTSAGTATASAAGDTAGSINSGAGSAAGSATVAAVGASTRAGAGAAAGVATAAASGSSTRASSGASAGIATAQATGRATAAAVA
jgi:hypothetical protein